MNRLPVALFGSRAIAEQLCSRLRERGIPAEVHEELRLEKLWFVPKGAAGARLEVPAAQFDLAERTLLDWDAAESALRDAIRCPECHSLRVEYPQVTHKSMMTNLALGLASSVGMVEKEFYCRDCHYTWPKEDGRPHRVRPHMAPHYFIEDIAAAGEAGQESKTASEHRHAA
jgi:hypothetical protein